MSEWAGGLGLGASAQEPTTCHVSAPSSPEMSFSCGLSS